MSRFDQYLPNTMCTPMNPLRSLLFLLLGSALLLGAADVQAQTTRAALSGTVVDENDEPLPGANVVAVHEPSGTQYGASTRANGQFNLQGLRVGGPYTVTVSFVGYQSIEETGITLSLNERREIDFALQPASDELDEVLVRGDRAISAVIDRSRTGARTNVTSETIDRLPSIDRSLADLARLTPQAAGGGSSSIGGRNNRFNAIQVDGGTLDDVFGLSGTGAPGGQAGAQPISLDAIEEFNVDIAPFDVRQNGFTGGRINAITKSGTNTFEGSLRYLGRNQSFIGDLDGQSVEEDFSEQYFIGTLGGPIIEDRLFFFVSAEFVREDSPLETQVGPNIDGANVFREDPQTLLDIRNIAQDTYGYDPGGFEPLSDRTDNNKVLAKIDWNINSGNRLSVRHNWVDASDDSGIGRSGGTFSLENRRWIFNSVQNSTSAELTSQFGNNAYNEARLVYTRIRDSRDVGSEPFPETRITLPSNRNVDMGINRFSQANQLDQDILELTNDFFFTRGDHSITVGARGEVFQFRNVFIRDFYGSYQFEGFEIGDTEVTALEAFERGQPLSFEHSFARNPDGTFAEDDALRAAEFTGVQAGLYVQDEWDVTNDLRLTIGLRADVPLLPEDPTRNEDVEETFPDFRTDEVPGGLSNILWAPRLGFNYTNDLVFDGLETQIRGGAGMFSGRPPFVWISNQYSNTGVEFARINQNIDPEEVYVDDDGNYDPTVGSCFPGTGDPADQPKPGGDCLNRIDGFAPEGTSEINLTATDFRYPQTLRTNVGIDQELPFFGLTATFEGIYSNSLNDVAYRDINQQVVDESAYGRPVYGEAGRFGTPDRIDDRFTNVLVLDNTNQGYEYSFTGQLQRNAREGLSGSVSYTYSQAKTTNAATSSQAVSNWRFNPSTDINNPELGTSDFEVRHRALATLNYRIPWSERSATTFGIFWEGRSGSPFSWIYLGDAGADGTNNDLVFVPAQEDDIFLTSDNWELMDAFIAGEDGLNDFRGGVVDVNSSRDPFQNRFDLNVRQEVMTFGNQRVEIQATVENFLNMINDDWGRIRFSSFNDQIAWEFEGYVQESDVGSEINGRLVRADDVGKDIVSFEEQTAQNKLRDEFFGTSDTASRWQLQLGVRYVF